MWLQLQQELLLLQLTQMKAFMFLACCYYTGYKESCWKLPNRGSKPPREHAFILSCSKNHNVQLSASFPTVHLVEQQSDSLLEMMIASPCNSPFFVSCYLLSGVQPGTWWKATARLGSAGPRCFPSACPARGQGVAAQLLIEGSWPWPVAAQGWTCCLLLNFSFSLCC